jgi:glucose/arabinose dehydrogenase
MATRPRAHEPPHAARPPRPEEASTGLVEVRSPSGASNTAPLRVARQLSDGLHPVTSPAVSRSGMIYATISGPRGKQTPVSIVRISPDGRGTPFVTGILNATGLAFNPDGDLFVTSRAEGNVYRIDPSGESTVYAEGMGVATGAAFDAEATSSSATAAAPSSKSIPSAASSSTPRLSPAPPPITWPSTPKARSSSPRPRSTPTTPSGPSTPTARPAVWYRGLGRPQGLALSKDGDVYVTACLHGRRGLVRVTPAGEASLVLAGPNLVGVAFSPLGTTVLATNEAVFDVDLGVEGLTLF